MKSNLIHSRTHELFNLNLPGLDQQQNTALAILLENFFAGIELHEKTQQIHKDLTKKFIDFFNDHQIDLPPQLYKSDYDFKQHVNPRITNVDSYANYIIPFALRSAIISKYIHPILVFFKTKQLNQIPYSIRFAIQKLNNTLAQSIHNNEERCEFFKHIFFRYDETSSIYDERLDLVFYLDYFKNTNSLSGNNKDNFQLLLRMIIDDINELIEEALTQHPNNFADSILFLKNKLYFDEQTEKVCKKMFLQKLCENPGNFGEENITLEAANLKAKLYLDCIADQLQNLSLIQQAKIEKVLEITKEDPEKSLTCLWKIILLAKAFIQRPGFLIFMKPKVIQDDFFIHIGKLHDKIGEIYKTCYPNQHSYRRQSLTN